MNQYLTKTINISGYIALALSTIWSVYWVFFGLELSDSFYFTCKFLYSGEVDVFLQFTQFMMKCCNRLFGDYMIGYRLVNWLFYFLTYLSVYLFVLSVNKEFRKYGLWFLSMALVLMTNINTNVFSGESISAFFLICTFISLYKATYGNRLWFIGLIVSVTLCVLSQFPNVVLLPILLATSWLFCNRKSNYGLVVVSLTISSALYLLINSILYGGIGVYVNTLTDAFTSTASNREGADHSMGFLLSEYLHTLKDTMSDIKFLSVIGVIPLISFFTSKKYTPYIAAIAFIFAQLAFIKMRVAVISDVYNYGLIVYFYALIFISVFSIIALGLLRHNWKMVGYGIIPLCISLCSPAGSDSGLCLLGGTLFTFIPWFVYTYKKMLTPITRKELVYLILSLVGLSISAFVYVREGMMIYGISLIVCTLVALWCIPYIKWQKMEFTGNIYATGNKCSVISYIILGFVMVVFTCYAKNRQSFEWISPKEFTCQYRFKQLKHIWTNPRSCQYVEAVMHNYNSLEEQGKSVVFFGRYSYVFNYLAHQAAVPGVEFTQTDIPRNIYALEQFIENNDVIVILSPYDPARQLFTTDEYPNTKLMLERHGYIYEDRENKYTIFYPQTDKSNNKDYEYPF